MVESPPASALKMTQADFLFEFLVVAFNAPPQLGRIYQLCKGNGRIKVGKPIFCGFRFSLGPLDQQPFFRRAITAPIITMPFAHPHGGKSRGEHLVGAFPPGDGLICAIWLSPELLAKHSPECAADCGAATSAAAHSPNTQVEARVRCPVATPWCSFECRARRRGSSCGHPGETRCRYRSPHRRVPLLWAYPSWSRRAVAPRRSRVWFGMQPPPEFPPGSGGARSATHSWGT